MPATWLADALRAGGLAVDETIVSDWKSRGHTDGPRMDTVVGVMGHHTAGPAAGNLPSLGTVRDGRPDLAGPLANLMLARDGTWVPIAAGRCWHAGAADKPAAWPWIPAGDANGYVLGVEAESAGTGDWTPAQRDSYPRGVAALLHHQGLPAGRFLGHLEWAPSRKVDPHGWPGDMATFRATVTDHLTGAADDMPYTEDDLSRIVQAAVRGVPVTNGVTGQPEQMGTTVGYMEQRIVDRVTKQIGALSGALSGALTAMSQLVAQQNGLTLDDVRAAVATEIAKGVAVHVDVQPATAAAGGAPTA